MKSFKLICKFLTAPLILAATMSIPLQGFVGNASIHHIPDGQATTAHLLAGTKYHLNANGNLVSDSLTAKELGTSNPASNSIDLFRAGTYLVLACELNGKPAYFLIDTGASYSILHNKLAKVFDLTLLERKDLKLTGFGRNSGSIQIAIGAELDLSNKKVPHSFLAQDLSKLIRLIRSESNVYLTGIMGTDLLKRIGGKVDLKNKLLYLY